MTKFEQIEMVLQEYTQEIDIQGMGTVGVITETDYKTLAIAIANELGLIEIKQ